MSELSSDPRAPMASAPMRYLPDGQVDWGNMWESFCGLARDGGPPHRGTLLTASAGEDVATERYQATAAELIRGIAAVSGLRATHGEPGWLAVSCPSAAMAAWLAEAILAENVAARACGAQLLVPVAAHYTLKGEIKNVITAVAKTTHYWHAHLPAEARDALAAQALLRNLGAAWRGWLRGASR